MGRRPKLYPETQLADYRAMKKRLLNPIDSNEAS